MLNGSSFLNIAKSQTKIRNSFNRYPTLSDKQYYTEYPDEYFLNDNHNTFTLDNRHNDAKQNKFIANDVDQRISLVAENAEKEYIRFKEGHEKLKIQEEEKKYWEGQMNIVNEKKRRLDEYERQTNVSNKDNIRFNNLQGSHSIENEILPKKAISLANKLQTNIRAGVLNKAESYLQNNFSPKSTISSPITDQKPTIFNVSKKRRKSAHKHPNHRYCAACSLSKETLKDQIYNLDDIIMYAKTLIFKKKYNEADIFLDEYVQKGIIHSDLFYLAGEVKRILHMYEESENLLLRTLSFEVHSPFVYNSLGILYKDTERYDKAVPLLYHFIEETEDTHFNIGYCLYKCEKYLESGIHLSKAIEMSDVGNLHYYSYRALAYEKLGLIGLAQQDYKRCLEIDPSLPGKYMDQATRLERDGKHMEAIELRRFIYKFLI